MNSTVKTIMFWVFIVVCLRPALDGGAEEHGHGIKDPEIPYSDLLDKIQAGQVQDATIQGTELHGHLKCSQGRVPHHHSRQLRRS